MDDGILHVESYVATSMVLPPPTSSILTYVPTSTILQTFFGVMQEPITTLFSSQSTKKSNQEAGANNDDIMVSFVKIQFNPEEENIPDELIMSAFHSKSIDYEIQKLRDVTKECHELFVEKVSTMKESLDLKVAELKSMLSEKVKKMEENYKLLHGKVDVIVDAITRLVDFNNEYTK
ncbi:unnamed protein product [Lactuca saligna]|uniref:Uncharacterized protein n=1 Tax=Lactuca saligna TaxID=75948 RepID=A0AA36EE71_LACSI|nr:unnamed protein product [Lactuca saligna]